MLVAIYNPVSGSCTAKQVFDDQVFPLLVQRNESFSRHLVTEYAGHAGIFVKELVGSIPDDEEIDIVLGSGDGTLHEIINSVSNLKKDKRAKVSIALVPCGTANALYSSLFPPAAEEPSDYRLRSLNSYLNEGKRKPITLAVTTPTSANGDRGSPLVASVVVSTALHASILHDSENLRKEMPGIERFKVAAQQNSTRWYDAEVELSPISGTGTVQIYDPLIRSFVPAQHTKLKGPFAYFLSTVNVDRLEPAFRITPLAVSLPPEEASIDVLIIRPLRGPDITCDGQKEREAFVSKMWAVLGGAYRDGEHVNMWYDEKGEPTIEKGVETIVEYYRCGGWAWSPVRLLQ